MAFTSGVLAHIDWENFTPGDLDGQNGWRVQNEDGVRPGGFDSIIITEVGAPSGQIAMRDSADTGADSRRAVMVLDSSGVDRTSYDKVSIEVGMTMNQEQGRSVILLRPSGDTNDTMNGYRVQWEHNDGPDDNIALARLDNGAVSTLATYPLNRAESLRLLVEDDDESITIWANASGTWEFVHQEATTTYNYLPTSGAFQLRTDDAGLVQGIDDIIFYGVETALSVTSGTIAHIDFEDYSAGRLFGQGTSPYIWSEHDANGGSLNEADAFSVIENGAPSGKVARRNSTNSGGVDGRSQIILQSGIPGTGVYHKVAYQWDMSLPSSASQWGYFTALQLRPSGAVYDGKRVIYAGLRSKRTAASPYNAALHIYARNNTSTIFSEQYFLELDNTIEDYSFQVIDDLENEHIDVFVNASGFYEHIFSIDSDAFLDHPASGAFLNFTGGTGSANNVIIDNISIIGFSYSTSTTTTESGQIGGYTSYDAESTSGQIGGYTTYDAASISGQIGGYTQGVGTTESGQIGGYILCSILSESGQIGGYTTYDAASISGQVGGYINGLSTGISGQIGGYTYSESAFASGQIGGYLSVYDSATPEEFNETDSAILSWWYLDESGLSDDAIDYGSYGNDAGKIGNDAYHEIVTSGVQNTYCPRDHARCFKNFGTATNAKYRLLNTGPEYTGDTATNFTVMAWVWASGALVNTTCPIVNIQRDDQTFGNSARWQLALVGATGKLTNKLQFTYRHGPNNNELSYVTSPYDAVGSGQWAHVAAVFNKTDGYCRIFVNGAMVASGAATGVMGSGTSDDVGIGGNMNPANSDFTGALNDVMFVGKALTDGQIAFVAQSGVGPIPSDAHTVGGYLDGYLASVTANEEQMQAVWRLNEAGDNDTRVDSSTKGNDLDIIIGSPEQILCKVANGTRFQHWSNPYPSLQRTGSGVSDGLNPTTENWSMGMWIKPSGVAYERYAQLAGKGSYEQYVMYIDEEGEVWGQLSIDGIGYVVASQPSSLIANEWQHIDWIVDRTNQIQYIYQTRSDNIPNIIASGALPNASKLQDTTTEPFHVGASPTNQQPFDGDLDEIYFIQRALSSGEIVSICKVGLPTVLTTGASGSIGGYLASPESVASASGQVGGYTIGVQAIESGQIGGYLEQLSVASGVSGQIGGYVDYDFATSSGQVGGYVLYEQDSVSGQIGGYVISEGFDEPSAFLSFFDFISPESLDFDLVARIGSAETGDFDARLQILRQYTAPTVTCYVTGSGTIDGFYHITVSGTVTVGDTTIQNGALNGIDNVWIQFGDMSGQKDITPSDGVFEVEHTFNASGVYIIRVDAIDKQGTHGSCQERVDLSVGLAAGDIIQLNLGGTPQSGVMPHTVAFTQSYTAQPVGVKESIIHFGDRTLTHYSNPVHLYHSVGSYIPIWIVRDDNGRFWCDSLVIGVNQ